MDPLIQQRDAVWRSIAEYDPLAGTGIDDTIFQRALRWKETSGEVRFDQSLPPFASLATLPLISIRTVGGEDTWAQHREKKQVHRIEVKLVTKGHNQDEPSEIRKQIRRAIHQVPSAANTYLRQASGYQTFNVTFPEFEFTVTEQSVVDDPETGEKRLTWGSAVTIATFVIEITFEDNPAQDTD